MSKLFSSNMLISDPADAAGTDHRSKEHPLEFPYHLQLDIKGTALSGSPRSYFLETSIDGKVVDTTAPAQGEAATLNRKVTAYFKTLEPRSPIIVSITMYKIPRHKWGSSKPYQVIGTTQFPILNLMDVLNKEIPTEGTIPLKRLRRGKKRVGYVTLALQLNHYMDNRSNGSTTVKPTASFDCEECLDVELLTQGVRTHYHETATDRNETKSDEFKTQPLKSESLDSLSDTSSEGSFSSAGTAAEALSKIDCPLHRLIARGSSLMRFPAGIRSSLSRSRDEHHDHQHEQQQQQQQHRQSRRLSLASRSSTASDATTASAATASSTTASSTTAPAATVEADSVASNESTEKNHHSNTMNKNKNTNSNGGKYNSTTTSSSSSSRRSSSSIVVSDKTVLHGCTDVTMVSNKRTTLCNIIAFLFSPAASLFFVIAATITLYKVLECYLKF